mmetsp:Transcript_29490/g.56637  ORF Transcript_29490/g.56637 Transcript_29490/m.56637 type:complete len:789 (+) Transcript_29490:288-2654(+)
MGDTTSEDPWGDGSPDDALDEVKNVKAKTVDEVEKFFVDENLTDLQLCAKLLSGKVMVQVHNALTRLPALYRANGRQAHDHVASALRNAMEEFDAEDYITLADSYTDIVQANHLSMDDLKHCILPTTLEMLRKSNDAEVVDSWLGVLFELIPLMDQNTLGRDIADLALSKGEVDMTAQSRLLFCRIVGKLAPHVQPTTFETRFISKAMALCQDTDYQVRICMCEQLDSISRATGLELTRKLVMPELMELLNDEETAVRVAAFECVVNLLDFLHGDLRKEVFQLIKQFIGATDEATMLCIGRLYGPLIVQVTSDFQNEDDWNIFYQVFKSLTHSQDPKLRQLAAFNFPGVLHSMGVRKYAMHLHGAYTHLCADPCDEVRECVAAGFLEVLRILGKDRALTYLKDSFLKLVADSNKEVQKKILSNLACVVEMFSVANETDRLSALGEILPALLAVKANLGQSWRLQVLVMQALPLFINHATPDQQFEVLVPLCFKEITSAVVPIKSAAAAALCLILRHLRRVSQRNEVLQRIVREFGKGKSCWSRILYVELCEHLGVHFSRRYFREHFLEAAVELLQDPVPNVRMRACPLLPRMKRMIRLPEDALLLERMSKLCTALTTDSDRDVSAVARDVVAQFKVAVPCSSKRDPALSVEEHVALEAADAEKERAEAEIVAREDAELKKRREDLVARAKANGLNRNEMRRLSETDLRLRSGSRVSGTLPTTPGAKTPTTPTYTAHARRSSSSDDHGPTTSKAKDTLSTKDARLPISGKSSTVPRAGALPKAKRTSRG